MTDQPEAAPAELRILVTRTEAGGVRVDVGAVRGGVGEDVFGTDLDRDRAIDLAGDLLRAANIRKWETRP